MSSVVLILFFIIVVVLLSLPFIFPEIIKKMAKAMYYIYAFSILVSVVIWWNGMIKRHYERETVSRILYRINELLNANEYEYLKEKMRKAVKVSNDDNFEKMNMINACLHQRKD